MFPPIEKKKAPRFNDSVSPLGMSDEGLDSSVVHLRETIDPNIYDSAIKVSDSSLLLANPLQKSNTQDDKLLIRPNTGLQRPSLKMVPTNPSLTI